MKNLLIILMLITSTVKAETIEISGNYPVLELSSHNTYNVVGDSKIQNLNWNGSNIKFEVKSGVNLELGTLNINNNGSFTNNGNILVTGWIDLNSITHFYSNGNIKSAGFQNNTNKMLEMCGTFETGSMQLNNGGIKSDCCLFIKTGHLDVGSENPLFGNIHIYIVSSLNLNHNLSPHKTVTYKYEGHVNTPNNWGHAVYVNSEISLCKPLPVKISQFTISDEYIVFKFTEVVDVQKIEIEKSLNGKDWKPIMEIKTPEVNTLYHYKINNK